MPYPLWQAPGNYIHKLQWEHVDLIGQLVETALAVADNAVSKRHAEIARGLMDPALHSCQFWWASRRPHWDVNMIARGLDQQGGVVLNAFRAINLSSAVGRGEARRLLQGRRVARHPLKDPRPALLGLTVGCRW